MDIILILLLLSFILFILFYIITKKIIKTIFITFIIITLLFTTLTIIIIKDAKTLEKLQYSDSLFILKDNNTFELAVSINFSAAEPTTLTNNELEEINNIYTQNKEELTNNYFKTFVFDKSIFKKTLSDEINIEDITIITKQQILEGLEEENLKQKSSFFILAVTNTLQFTETEKIKTFLKEYKNKNIEITPPIKAIYVLTFLPEEFIDLIKIPKTE